MLSRVQMQHRREMLCTVLRYVRKEAGLTQQNLAQRLGKPQSFIQKIENGERRVDVVELIAICEALNVDVIPFIKRYMEQLASWQLSQRQ